MKRICPNKLANGRKEKMETKRSTLDHSKGYMEGKDMPCHVLVKMKFM